VYFYVSFGFVNSDVFRVEGFPYKNQIEESFIIVVSYMSPNI